MLTGLPDVFRASGTRQTDDEAALVPELYQQIGRLQMELAWLQKKHEAVGG